MSLWNWISEKYLSLMAGQRVTIANGGKAVDEVIIRYKEFYFHVDIDVESGEPTGSFGWSTSPMTHIPVREFYVATRGVSNV